MREYLINHCPATPSSTRQWDVRHFHSLVGDQQDVKNLRATGDSRPGICETISPITVEFSFYTTIKASCAERKTAGAIRPISRAPHRRRYWTIAQHPPDPVYSNQPSTVIALWNEHTR
jgi:hypothetical protein